MRVAIWCVLVAVLLCLTLPVCGENRGGVYFDDVSLTNNGTKIFSDDFNSGQITVWSHPRPLVTLFRYASNPVNYCVYLNRMIDINTYMSRMPKCGNVGALEFKALVYLPGNQEQWNSMHGSRDRTRINIMTGRNEDWFYVAIDGNPRETGYRVQLTHVNPREKNTQPGGCGGAGADYKTSGPVIPPATWVELVFKLDPAAKTAAVSVNGRSVVSGPYDPSLIHSLSLFDLCTWMGDRQATQQPGRCIDK